MARKTDIRLRRSDTAGKIPTSSNLSDGELALNTNSGALYFKKSNDEIVTVHDNTILYIDSDTTGSNTTGSSPKVGIGTTSPISALQVKGDGKEIFLSSADHNIARIIPRGTGSNLDKGLLSLFDTGTEDVRIDTAGNSWFNGGSIGIGTTSPTSPLTVKSSSTSSQDSGFTLQANGSTNAIFKVGEKADGKARFHMFDGTTEKIAFYADGTANHISAGNLGIGTASPNQKLEIKTTSGTAGLRIHADHTSSPRTALEFMRGTSDTFGGDAFTDWKIGHVGNDQADFAIISHDSNRGANERVTIEYTTGNVGIGTASPNSALTVAGEIPNSPTGDGVHLGFRVNYAQMQLNGSAGGIIDFSTSGVDHVGRILYDQASDYMAFSTNTVERIRIDNSGNVGINTDSPAAKFDIFHGSANRLLFTTTGSDNFITSVNGANDTYTPILLNGSVVKLGTGGTERARIDSSGNLLVGTTNTFPPSDSGNEGVAIKPDNIAISRNASTALFLDRMTSDGTIVDFRKDGSIVGSIGTSSGSVAINARNTGILLFQSGGNEKARIDASGNLLIGQTAGNVYNQSSVSGFKLDGANGNLQIARSGNTVAFFNRLASDGTIVDFRKDGTTIGTVGAKSDDLYIGTGDTGIRFNDGNDQIWPISSAGTSRDNAIDIGNSSVRFKDLHLGGTANIGGNIVVTGNLTVNGTTTTLNTATLDVEDKNITLNKGSGDTSSSADGAGITIQDAVDADNDATILWDAANDKFTFSHSINPTNLLINDSNKIRLGNSQDAEIYHNGTHLYIDERDSGRIFIRSSDEIRLNKYTGEFMVRAIADGAVVLYHDNSTKLTTTAAGINVTGEIAGATAIRHANSNAQVIDNDNDTYFIINDPEGSNRIKIGDSGDRTTEIRNDTIKFTIANGTEKMRLDSSGRLGIGTSAPISSLTVLGANDVQGGITLTTSNTNSTQKVGRIKTQHYNTGEEPFTAILTNAQASHNLINIGGASGAENAATDIKFFTAANNTTLTGTQRMVIDSSGRVGIGTTAPATKLHVFTAGHFKVDTGASPIVELANNSATSSTSGTATLKFTQANTQAGGKIVSGRDGDYSNGSTRQTHMAFYTATAASDTEKIRITSSGNVGIGTTSPNSTLHISTSGAPTFRLSRTGTGQVWLQTIDSNGRLHLQEAASEGGTKNTRLKIDDTGEITFNEAYTFPTSDGTAGHVLKTDGSGNLSFATVSAGAAIALQDADGDTKIQVEESSDEDVIRMDTGGTERVQVTSNGLNVVSSGGYRLGGTEFINASRQLVNISSYSGGSITSTGTITSSGSGVTNVMSYSDRGIFGTTSNHPVEIRANNSEAIRITQAGNVGIGTSSPRSILDLGSGSGDGTLNDTPSNYQLILEAAQSTTGDIGRNIAFVNGTNNVSAAINSYDAGTGITNGLVFATASTGTLAERMRIDSSGRLFLGTSTVATANTAGDDFVIKGSGTGVGMTIAQDNANGTGSIFFGDPNSSSAGSIRYNHNTGDMALNVEDQLNIAGDIEIQGNGSGNSSHILYFKNSAAAIQRNNNDLKLHAYNAMIFGVSNTAYPTSTERMRIDSSGRVGIGTINPSVSLEVNGDIGIGRSAGAYTFRETVGGGIRAGVHSNSANELILKYGANTEGLRLNNSGNVGIGTTAPSSDLHIKSGGSETTLNLEAATVRLKINTNNFISANSSVTTFGVNGSEKMRLDSGGRLLVSATSTAFTDKLYVNNTAYSTGGFRTGTSATYVGKMYNNAGKLALETDSARDIQFGSSTNTQIMYIDTSEQRVGIGTTSPDFKFDTTGPAGAYGDGDNIIGVFQSVTDHQTALKIKNLNTNTSASAPRAALDLDTANHEDSTRNRAQFVLRSTASSGAGGETAITVPNDLRFFVNNKGTLTESSGEGASDSNIAGTEAMRISAAGNVGIGIAAPSEKLHVAGKILTGGQIRSGSYLEGFPSFSFANDTDTGMFSDTANQLEFSTGGTSRMSIASTGNVGIGVASPTSKLDIRGSGDADIMSKIINTGQTTNGRKTEFLFGKDNGANLSGVLKYVYNSTQASRRIDLVHYQTTNGISILDGGNVGIGLTNPSKKLHVDGDIAIGSSASGIFGTINAETFIAHNGTTDSGLRFRGSGEIIPCNSSGGGTNATTDLGSAGFKFGDIYSAGFIGSSATNRGFDFNCTDSTADAGFTGFEIDHNISGSDTLTADRTHRALYIDQDSSATGGDTSNEHRLYGIQVASTATGDSDLVYAINSTARAQHSSGQITAVRGGNFTAVADSSAATSQIIGVVGTAQKTVGGTMNSMYGVFGKSQVLTANTTTSGMSAFGLYGEVEMDATTTLTNADAVRAVIDRDAGVITNGYLYRGSYEGTRPTNAFGVYISSDVTNYFAGTVSIGNNNPDQNGLNVHMADAEVVINDTNSTPQLRFRENGTTKALIATSSGALTLSSGGGTVALTLDTSQNATFAGNISASSYSGALASTVTGTTQGSSDNSTKVATTAYVTTAIANLSDSAPSTLNTLNELAAALGDDANFSTTVTNSIATKLPLAGGTLTGPVTSTSNSGSASIYINSTRPTLGFTDSNSFTDANDIYLIRGTSGNKLQFQFFDNSAGTTTETFSVDNVGNTSIAGDIFGTGNFDIRSTGNIFNTFGNSSKTFFRTQDGTVRFVIDSAGKIGAGGNIDESPDADLHIRTSNLGGTSGDQQEISRFQTNVSNGSSLRFYTERFANGSDWTSAHTKIQQRIDTTDMGYIQFNGSGNNYGIELGTHTTSGTINLRHRGTIRLNTSTTGVNVTGGLSIGGTEVISSTRNLSNIVQATTTRINSQEYVVQDTRSVATTTDEGNRQVSFDFKQNTNGDLLSDGGTYHGQMLFQQWNDSSGGDTHALGFTDNGNIWHRRADIGGSSWGTWYKLVETGRDMNVSLGTIESGAITSSGNLVLDAAGHNYIELHSSTANTRKWRFYNGQAWNPDALLIYDQDADSTALTIETGKLGIARGANSLSHTLDVGGNVAISGTQVISSARAVENVTLSSGQTGARLQHNSWHYDSGNQKRFYFAPASVTYFGTGSAYVFRNSSDVGKFTISGTGGINLGGGDTLVTGTTAIAYNGTAVLDTSRNLTNIGTISSGAITSTGNLLLDVDNAEINLKSGVGTTSGAINWTFNTSNVDYASIKLPYATRATTGLHIDSGYPITLDATTRINFAISGNTRFRMTNTAFEVGTTAILDLNRNLTNIGTISSGAITLSNRLIIDPAGAKFYDNNTNGNSKGFRIGGGGLVPVNGSGTDTTNIVDIGTNSYRFKDLYLSGTISSGAITSTGQVKAQSLFIDSGGYTPQDAEGQEFKYYLVSQGTDQNYKKVADVTITTGLYKALALRVVLESQPGNFGNTAAVDKTEYVCLFYRSGGVQDDVNTAEISGQDPTHHNLRIVKTATGVYELQVRQNNNYRDAILKLEVLSTNGGSISIQDGNVNGSTSGTITTPSSSDTKATYSFNKVDTPFLNIQNNIKVNSTQILDSSRNLSNIGTITASGDITTADRIISKESAGGFYKLHTDGTFRAAFYDDNGNTQIYADGDGSNPFITLSGGSTHKTDIDGVLNLSGTNRAIKMNDTTVLDSSRNLENIGNINIGVLGTTATGILFLNGSTANKRAEIGCTNGNLHIDADNGNGIYLNWYGSQSATSTAGVYFGNANAAQVGRIDGSGNLTLSGGITAAGGLGITSSGTSTIAGTGYFNVNSNVGGVNTNGSHGLHIGWNKSNGGREINMIFDGGTTQADTEMIFTSTDGSTYTDIFQINGAVGTGVDIKSGGLRIGTTTVIDSSRNLTNIGTISSGNISSGDITIADASTPVLTLSDTGNGASGGASGKVIFKNTGGDAMGIGYTPNSTADSDMIISTNAGGTYGGYLGLDAGGILDSIADIILEPKTNVHIATGNLGIGQKSPTSHINTNSSFFRPDSSGKFVTVNGGANGSFIMLESSTTTNADQIGGLYWTRTGGQGDAHKQLAGIDVSYNSGSLGGGKLRFFTKPNNSGTGTPRMQIDHLGNIFIGSTAIIDQSRNFTNIGTISSGNITASKFIQSSSTGSSFYAAEFSRSGTGTTTPDVWGGNNTFVIGTSSSTEAVGFSGANAQFYGTISSGAITSTGDIRADGGDYYGDADGGVRYRGYGDTSILTGVNGATYLYAGNQTSVCLTLQSNRTIAPQLAIGQVNAFTTIIDSSRNMSNMGTISSGLTHAIGGTGSGTHTHAKFGGTAGREMLIRTRSDISGGQHSGCVEIYSSDTEGDGGEIALTNNGGVRLFVDGDGRIGLNTSSPVTRFHVNAGTTNIVARFESTDTAAIIQLKDSTGTAAIESRNDFRFKTSTSTEMMRLTTAGALHVEDDVIAFSTTVSDKRLKDNVKTIDGALDKVMKLRGVEYTWNKTSKKGQKDLGVIAQEVEEVLPEIVKDKEMALLDEKVYKTVDYEKLTAVLIEAVKEQQKEIEELKEKVDKQFNNK